MKETIDIKIQRIFAAHNLWFDYDITTENTCTVTIHWGDWKHEHGYLDYVMSKNGFELVKEDVTEEDGSDCYSSIHTYRLKKKR